MTLKQKPPVASKQEGRRQDALIPKAKTRGAEVLESTACDLKHEPTVEARSQLSSWQPLATEGQEKQQGEVRQCRRPGEAAAAVTLVACVAPVHPTGVWGHSAWWNLAILLCLLTRKVLKQALEIESLGGRLDAEIEKRNQRKR